MSLLTDAYAALLAGLTNKDGELINWERDNKPVQIEVVDLDNEEYIVHKKYHNGKASLAEGFKGDLPHGDHISYFSDGVLSKIFQYKDGQLDGVAKSFYYDGSVKREAHYREGVQHGVTRSRHKDSGYYQENVYDNGKGIHYRVVHCDSNLELTYDKEKLLLVVGLNNPEEEYEDTRHNIGKDVIDALMTRHQYHNKPMILHGSTDVFFSDKAKNIALCLPQTGMNSCGLGVKVAFQDLRIKPEQVIVVQDDMDFEPGQVRIKQGGGDGRHNGVKSVIKQIGEDFIRIRMGIGKPRTKEDGINFVLEKFSPQERKLMDDAVITAMSTIEHIAEHGVQDAMKHFNRKDQ